MLLFADAPTWASDYPIVAVLIGLVGLVGGAELLVRGAVWIALTLGMSQMAVGLTLVSIGTSLPELLVTLTAADDHADLAMGNVMGSNVANILLIVGVTASIRAIRLHVRWFELGFLMLLTAVLCLPFFGAHLVRWQSAVMLTILVVFVGQLLARERRERRADDANDDQRRATPRGWLIHSLLLSGGFILLAYSADWLVEGAAEVAKQCGMSPNVIGLTVIAIGTSMPELATSAVAALRGQPEICIGNVIGSNIFNIGAVLGGAGLLKPFAFDPHFADLGVTVAATLLLVLVLRKAGGVPRLLGVAMTIGYASFLAIKVVTDSATTG
ncbi:MAG: calcium/sodium antiporter [Planctomycetota bacterium]|nr:calcium/sodium antiporter [Planctomycetota bacterium]MEC9046829.1 calcium/sodium antiporter [Planctomycetota bacterium]